jgi:hypothetical protein
VIKEERKTFRDFDLSNNGNEIFFLWVRLRAFLLRPNIQTRSSLLRSFAQQRLLLPTMTHHLHHHHKGQQQQQQQMQYHAVNHNEKRINHSR